MQMLLHNKMQASTHFFYFLYSVYVNQEERVKSIFTDDKNYSLDNFSHLISNLFFISFYFPQFPFSSLLSIPKLNFLD